MPGQGRLGDKSSVALDAHGCPACPHSSTGPAIVGSPDVSVNRRPALRVGDGGIHAACCGLNTWTASKGSETVFINGKAAHRMNDETQHCGGKGQLVEGSSNVIVGQSSSAGAASSAGARRAAGSEPPWRCCAPLDSPSFCPISVANSALPSSWSVQGPFALVADPAGGGAQVWGSNAHVPNDASFCG